MKKVITSVPSTLSFQGILPAAVCWHGGQQGELPKGGTWHGGQQGELPKGGTWHMGRWGSSLESGTPVEETKTEAPAGSAGC